jgi:hypothetical protein
MAHPMTRVTTTVAVAATCLALTAATATTAMATPGRPRSSP